MVEETKISWMGWLTIRALIYPVLVSLISLIPQVNSSIFLNYEGIGSVLICLSFPWAIVSTYWGLRSQHSNDRKDKILVGLVILGVYVLFSIPIAFVLKKGLHSIGRLDDFIDIWKAYLIPLSLLL